MGVACSGRMKIWSPIVLLGVEISEKCHVIRRRVGDKDGGGSHWLRCRLGPPKPILTRLAVA